MTVYQRHVEEFTDRETFVLNLGVNPQGGNPNVRVFSQSGAVLLSMFANTPRAKDFRAWAKRVLVAEIERRNLALAPATERLDRIETAMDRIADHLGTLSHISAEQMRRMDRDEKYIDLLEKNQRGKHKVTPAIEAEAHRLHQQGMSQTDIAYVLHISTGTVSALIRGKYPRTAGLAGTPAPQADIETAIAREAEKRAEIERRAQARRAGDAS